MWIGISVGSMVNVPTLASSRLLGELAQRLTKKGYFLQSLPIKGSFDRSFPVGKYFESAWPPIQNGQYVGASLRDRLLFPAASTVQKWEESQRKLGAIEVVHELDSLSNGLIEVHKGNWAGLPTFLDDNPRRRLCIDTCHWRDIPGKPELSDFLSKYEDRVYLIHAQPLRRSDEWAKYLRGEETELGRLLRILFSMRGGPREIVMEVSPLLHPTSPFNKASINVAELERLLDLTCDRMWKL